MNDTKDAMWKDNPLLVIISNRGPFSFSQKENGEFDVRRGAGGLVTALWALAERHDVLWVASALSEDDRLWAEAQNGKPANVEGISLLLVQSPEERLNQFYNIISNPLLWFIQHEMWDIPRTPSITEDIWEAWEDGYLWVNRQFSEAVVDVVKDEPATRPVIIMPQDYHLYMMPEFLREQLDTRFQIQPFIHIPWPGPDGWRVLPDIMRQRIFNSMLQADRVGFQTKRDAFNFVQTCRFYLEGAHSRGSRNSIEYKGRKVFAIDYPISIDVEKVELLVEEPATTLQKNQLLSVVGDRKLILRTDRIEPSKNILRGLESFRDLLIRYPEHRGKVQLLQLLVPSRLGVEEYSHYLQDIMASAGMINAEFSEEFYEPVRTIVGNNYARALAAMQIYDVLMVNPIADGMNLVAKEGALVNNRDGVLILSENAGAVYELGDESLTISPFDTYSTANALHDALTMERGERHRRAEKLKARVKKADVRAWFAAQVEDALKAFSNQSKKSAVSSTPVANKSE